MAPAPHRIRIGANARYVIACFRPPLQPLDPCSDLDYWQPDERVVLPGLQHRQKALARHRLVFLHLVGQP